MVQLASIGTVRGVVEGVEVGEEGVSGRGRVGRMWMVGRLGWVVKMGMWFILFFRG